MSKEIDANNKLALRTLNKITLLEKRFKALKEQREKLSELLKEVMEKAGVKKFENEFLSVNYIAATSRNDFDKKKFEEDQPIIYKEYLKSVNVKASVRIKVKEEKE